MRETVTQLVHCVFLVVCTSGLMMLTTNRVLSVVKEATLHPLSEHDFKLETAKNILYEHE